MNSYYPLLGVLRLVALVPEAVAQSSARSAALQQSDPSGLALTLTAVGVVFTALAMLVIVFKLIGRLMQRLNNKPAMVVRTEYPQSAVGRPQEAEVMTAIALALDAERRQTSPEVAIAISMALRAYLEPVHDTESFVLTFAPRRATQWSNKAWGMRQYPN